MPQFSFFLFSSSVELSIMTQQFRFAVIRIITAKSTLAEKSDRKKEINYLGEKHDGTLFFMFYTFEDSVLTYFDLTLNSKNKANGIVLLKTKSLVSK
jgi:hypothetical protein